MDRYEAVWHSLDSMFSPPAPEAKDWLRDPPAGDPPSIEGRMSDDYHRNGMNL